MRDHDNQVGSRRAAACTR